MIEMKQARENIEQVWKRSQPAVAEPAKMNWGELAMSVALCEAAGIIGALVTDTGRSSWYQKLKKPSFNPPSWIFGPVWTTLYGLMGYSLQQLWHKRDEPGGKQALRAFATQLALNASWTPVFFGLKSPEGGLVIIVALWVEIIETIARARKISPAAAAALLPYGAWVSFATVLNASIVALNRKEEPDAT